MGRRRAERGAGKLGRSRMEGAARRGATRDEAARHAATRGAFYRPPSAQPPDWYYCWIPRESARNKQYLTQKDIVVLKIDSLVTGPSQ